MKSERCTSEFALSYTFDYGREARLRAGEGRARVGQG
jgi:hypothetical protein